MRNCRIFAGATALITLILAAPAHASFEYTEVGPRATAMAGAGVSYNPHVTGMFYNPAHLTQMSRSEAFMSYENLYMGLSDGSKIARQILAVGMPLKRGRWGRLGIGLHDLGLAGFYSERTMMLGYSRKAGRNFHWGLNIRQLTATYGQDEYTAVNPVFKAGSAASAMGIDLGFLINRGGHQWGISFINANEPDLGILHPNKVDRGINIGLSVLRRDYEWSSQILQTGGDIRFKTGFERRFGKAAALRGGFNLGSRSYRNFSVGFGFGRKSFVVDYAVMVPLSGIPGIMGHHQVGLTWKFGRDYSRRIPALPEPGEGASEEGRGVSASTATVAMRPPAAVQAEARKSADELAAEAREDAARGDYTRALRKLQLVNEMPVSDRRYQEIEGRLAAVVRLDAEVDPKEAPSRLVRRGLAAFVAGDGRTAIESLTYASQKWPEDRRLKSLSDLARRQYPEVAGTIKPIGGLNVVEQKLEETLSLIYDGRFTEALTLCGEALELEPDHVLALVRQGSAYWALGRRETARAVWKRALELDPDNKDVIEFLNRKDPAAAPKAPRRKEPAKTEAPKPPGGNKAAAEVEAQYKEQLAYYERLKRMGVNKNMLKLVLNQMLTKFKGTGIDTTYIETEMKKY